MIYKIVDALFVFLPHAPSQGVELVRARGFIQPPFGSKLYFLYMLKLLFYVYVVKMELPFDFS